MTSRAVITRVSLLTTAMSKAFAFDIDGVLLRGGTVLKGATKSLDLLNNKRIPWILLTNGGGTSERDRVAVLSEKLKVKISPGQFLQSHTPFQDFVGSNDRILVVGGENDRCRQVAKEYGFRDVVIPADIAKTYPDIFPYPTLTSTLPGAHPLVNPKKPFDAIFVYHDTRDATADVQLIIDLLLSKGGVLGTREKHGSKPAVPIYFSNGDLQWATSYCQSRLGQGALIAMVKALYRDLTGYPLECTIIGKPTLFTYKYADKLLREWGAKLGHPRITETFMIGDNQASDIMGANKFGWKSVLVRSGVYQDGDDLYTRPTYICDDVLTAVETALESP